MNEHMEEVKRLAHAYADAKLMRYGMNSTDPLSADPEKAFSELIAHIQRRALPASFADMAVYQAIADGYARDTAPASAEVPVPESIEQLAITRYRTRPKGMFGCEVVAGDGSRSLFEGSRTECCSIARKLAEAFLDGAHVAIAAGAACRAAGYARGREEAGRDAERYRWLCDKATEQQWVELGGYTLTNIIDDYIDAAMRGEAKT